MKRIIMIMSFWWVISSYAVTVAPLHQEPPSFISSPSCANQTICTVNVSALRGQISDDHIILDSSSPEKTVQLASNHTTGYRWEAADYDQKLLSVNLKKYVSTSHLLGGGGYELWTIKAKAVGFSSPRQTQVRMIYIRSWEKKVPPIQERTIQVIVY